MKNFLRKYSLYFKFCLLILGVLSLVLFFETDYDLLFYLSIEIAFGFGSKLVGVRVRNKQVLNDILNFIGVFALTLLMFVLLKTTASITFTILGILLGTTNSEFALTVTILSLPIIIYAKFILLFSLEIFQEDLVTFNTWFIYSKSYAVKTSSKVNQWQKGFWENMIPPEFQEERFGDLLELNDYLKEKGTFIFKRWGIISFQFMVIVGQALYQKLVSVLGRNQVGKNQ